MTQAEIKLQLGGLALAMQSPEIQAAIRHGRRHAIGFAVFLWANECAAVVESRTERARPSQTEQATKVHPRLRRAGRPAAISKPMI